MKTNEKKNLRELTENGCQWNGKHFCREKRRNVIMKRI